jgi:tetratricopeptide (TPR) repeat protein
MTDSLTRWFDNATDAAQPLETRLNALARAIDLATDSGNHTGLERADELVEQMSQEQIPASSAATLAYYRANIWSAIRALKGLDTPEIWDWQGEETQQEILYLRQSAHHPGFVDLDPVRQCQIDTNLGNLLNHVGRFVEAIESWDSALTRIPRFAMARGNRGHGLRFYSRALYDRGHKTIMMLAAYDDLSAALGPNAFFDSPDTQREQEAFRRWRDELASHMDVAAVREWFAKLSGSPGRSKSERAYRRWCLDQRLFLNPLNDLGSLPVADHDVLTTPNFVTNVGEPPTLIRFFNILKQEFVSSRFLLYSGLHSKQVHYSDRGVSLSNTLDYPAYGLAVEQAKCAFRMTYSLFDKMGQFINHYWKLGVKREGVTFRRIWYRETEKKYVLRDEFRLHPNWPLRGLFWLSRDLYDPAPGFRDHTEPDARALNELRNKLEHDFVSVHGMDWSGPFADMRHPGTGPFGPDPNLYAVARGDLSAKALRILKLARAALIYLALAMHTEERRRAGDREDSELVVPMDLDTWKDNWKK